MKYQKIDQIKEVKQLRTQKAGEAKFSAWLAHLDQQQYEILKQANPASAQKLKPLIESAAKRLKFQEDRLSELTKLGAEDPSIINTQQKWLNQRIEELEREHARAEEVRGNAKVYGADSAKIAWDIKIIEAALKVCSEALKKLKK